MEYKDFYLFLKDCKKYDKRKKEAEELYSKLEGADFKLNLEELNTFSYNELSDIHRMIKPFASKDVLAELKKLVLSKKYEEFPALSMAIYYPILNKLIESSDISKEEARKIDRILFSKYKRKVNPILKKRELVNFLGDHEKAEKVASLLEEDGVLTSGYLFFCECRDCEHNYVFVSSEKMEKHKKVWEFEEKTSDLKTYEQVNTEGYEEYSKYEEEGLGIISIYCDEEPNIEIVSMKDLMNSKSYLSYKVNIEPKLTDYTKLKTK